MSPHTTSLLIEKMPMTKTVQKMAECQNVLTAENASLWAKIENKKVIMLDGSGENEMNHVNSAFHDNNSSLSV